MISLLSMAALAAVASMPVTAPGPAGPLAGTYLNAGAKTPVVLMIRGLVPPIATAIVRWG
jgi:uncharacterized protein